MERVARDYAVSLEKRGRSAAGPASLREAATSRRTRDVWTSTSHRSFECSSNGSRTLWRPNKILARPAGDYRTECTMSFRPTSSRCFSVGGRVSIEKVVLAQRRGDLCVAHKERRRRSSEFHERRSAGSKWRSATARRVARPSRQRGARPRRRTIALLTVDLPLRRHRLSCPLGGDQLGLQDPRIQWGYGEQNSPRRRDGEAKLRGESFVDTARWSMAFRYGRDVVNSVSGDRSPAGSRRSATRRRRAPASAGIVKDGRS